MLLVNRNNSRELYNTMFRIIINLRHIPNYDKFVKFILTELTPFIADADADTVDNDNADNNFNLPPPLNVSRQNSVHSLIGTTV
jgi:predicted HAD superfamily hydrolase